MTTSRFKGVAGLLGRLDHVAIAVSDIDAALSHYRGLFGDGAVGAPFDLPSQGVRLCFVDAPNVQVELIQPLGEDSPVTAFLARMPTGGQHHLCYAVPDIARAEAAFEARGVRTLGAPRPGAHGAPVLFLHPKDMGGVLVELVESPGDGH